MDSRKNVFLAIIVFVSWLLIVLYFGCREDYIDRMDKPNGANELVIDHEYKKTEVTIVKRHEEINVVTKNRVSLNATFSPGFCKLLIVLGIFGFLAGVSTGILYTLCIRKRIADLPANIEDPVHVPVDEPAKQKPILRSPLEKVVDYLKESSQSFTPVKLSLLLIACLLLVAGSAFNYWGKNFPYSIVLALTCYAFGVILIHGYDWPEYSKFVIDVVVPVSLYLILASLAKSLDRTEYVKTIEMNCSLALFVSLFLSLFQNCYWCLLIASMLFALFHSGMEK